MAATMSDQMDIEEIQELMELRGWTKRDLARALDMHETGIGKWFLHKQNPIGPAKILMRFWLEESRAEVKGTKKPRLIPASV